MMASEFCERALKEIRVLGTGRSMTNEQASDTLAALNSMLALWSIDDLVIPYRTRETLTMTAGTNPHTIGSGGTFNTGQPTDIHSATIVVSGSRYPLQSMTLGEYQGVPDSTIQSMPVRYYYERGLTLGSLYFDFTPAEAYSMELVTLKAFTGFAALTTDDDLPNEYETAIVKNLAIYMAPQFGKDPKQATVQVAVSSLASIKRNVSASRVPVLSYDPALRPGRANFNIDSYETMP